MTDWRIGQEIVCIDNKSHCSVPDPWYLNALSKLEEGEIYIIADMKISKYLVNDRTDIREELGFILKGIDNPMMFVHGQYYYVNTRFRPAEKLSLKQFEHLLAPMPVELETV